MKNNYFKTLEQSHHGDEFDMHDVMSQLAFNDKGLIPVITQDATTHKVLMMAWMNSDALQKTLSTQRVTYWSRSRKQLWIKGETSGHTQELVSMSFDCDGDAILCLVNQIGAACHTGRPNCFYLNVNNDKQKVIISNH